MTGQGPGADRPQLLEPVLGPGEMVAVEEASARLTEQELLPAERHLTVTLLDEHVSSLTSIRERLRQATSVAATRRSFDI